MQTSRWLSPFGCLYIALGLALAPPASAELITFDFTATVKSVSDASDLLDDSVHVGTPITGSYTFDSSAPGTPTSISSSYDMGTPGCGVETQVGRYLLRTGGQDPSLRITLENDSINQRDAYTVMGWGDVVTEPTLMIGALVPVSLTDPTQTALSSTALPLTPPDLNSYSGRINYIVFEPVGGGPLASVRSYVETLTLRGPTPIPEPGSLALLVSSAAPLSALWARRRSPLHSRSRGA